MSVYDTLALDGAAVRRLMRKHRCTIRGLASQECVTQRYIRKLRADGATGFRADEAHKWITGRWLVHTPPQDPS